MNDVQSTFRPFDRPVPPAPTCDPDPVGALEVATRLGVQDRSVHMMRRRGVLPPPDYDEVNGVRVWEWRTILWWAGETDRLRTAEARADYILTFGENPPLPQKRTSPEGVAVLADDTPEVPALPSKPKAVKKAPAKKAAPARVFNPRPKAGSKK